MNISDFTVADTFTSILIVFLPFVLQSRYNDPTISFPQQVQKKGIVTYKYIIYNKYKMYKTLINNIIFILFG
jgi:hypothetical protein